MKSKGDLMLTKLVWFGLALLAGLMAAACVIVTLTWSKPSQALPQYTARSARTCDNCHVEPTGWENPALPERICTLSCSGCHVDPAGGGLRTVSGLYFGRQTLPAFGATERPWNDREPHLFGILPGRDNEDRFRRQVDYQSEATSQPSSMPTSQPSSMPSSDDSGDLAAELNNDPTAWGSPLGPESIHAFDQARYNGLNADPLLRVGVDARYAALGRPDGWTFFPMQLDIGAALHPVEHLTLMVEGAAWGGQTGAGTQVAGEEVSLWGLHEAFLMTHEWPFNSYAKVGRFQPQFGWRLDDHTAFVRRNLGFDPSRPDSWGSGAEVGFNANYPYFSAAVFQLNAGQHDFLPDEGTGFSANAGWRDLSWGAGTSAYHSNSPDEVRTMVGGSWYFNPWRFWPRFPFTYMGEVDWIQLRNTGDSAPTQQVALFHELDWAPLNGVNLRFRYDFFDPDVDVRNDHEHRLNLQMDFHPFRFTELQTVLVHRLPTQGTASTDFLTILRFWM